MKFPKIINGFLIGVGFSTACLAIGVLYSLTLEYRVEGVIKDFKNDVMSTLDTNFVDSMKLEMLDYEVKGDAINIAVKSLNLNDPVYSAFFTIRLSLFSKDSEFMGNCDNKIPEVNSKEDLIYYSLSCETTFLPVSEFQYATVSVIRNREPLEINFVQ